MVVLFALSQPSSTHRTGTPASVFVREKKTRKRGVVFTKLVEGKIYVNFDRYKFPLRRTIGIVHHPNTAKANISIRLTSLYHAVAILKKSLGVTKNMDKQDKIFDANDMDVVATSSTPSATITNTLFNTSAVSYCTLS